MALQNLDSTLDWTRVTIRSRTQRFTDQMDEEFDFLIVVISGTADVGTH